LVLVALLLMLVANQEKMGAIPYFLQLHPLVVGVVLALQVLVETVLMAALVVEQEGGVLAHIQAGLETRQILHHLKATMVAHQIL
jgi:hypothetical protein